MREETTFFAPVREIEVVGAGAERATTCVDALSHRPLWFVLRALLWAYFALGAALRSPLAKPPPGAMAE